MSKPMSQRSARPIYFWKNPAYAVMESIARQCGSISFFTALAMVGYAMAAMHNTKIKVVSAKSKYNELEKKSTFVFHIQQVENSALIAPLIIPFQ